MVRKLCIHYSILWNIVISTYIVSVSTSQQGFYAIAHMVNTKEAITWAIQGGANALEMDLQFDTRFGSPLEFYHGTPCDCTCYKFVPFLSSDNLCQQHNRPCKSKTKFSDMLQHLLKFPSIALVYIDSKSQDLSTNVQKTAGKKVIEALEKNLFKKGYQGKVLIGSGRDKPYLIAASKHATASTFNSQIYFTLDWSNEGTIDALNFLTNLSSGNIIYSNGHSVCYPLTYHRAIRTAAVNKLNGVISSVFIWTVDSKISFATYYSEGARGILTNKIKSLVSWAKSKNIRFAVPGDDSLKSATSRTVINPKCDCDYSKGGCVISKEAPPNTACRCTYHPLYRCSGDVIMCKDRKSWHCKRPGKTIQDCVEGGGNCDGHENQQCDCKYYWKWGNGGCKVTTAAPLLTACKCTYRLFSCHGHVIRCKSLNSSYCNSPDISKSSCLLGGGDCEGY